jgi:N6-L-threonylcarbamoyladenine synthase
MTLLALETSCDETSAAVVRDGKVLSNVVSSQIKLHEEYGGVVPELAAREHLKNLLPVAQAALHQAGIGRADLPVGQEASPGVPLEIDAVAATQGPGLAIALLVGFKAAQAVAFALNKPFIGINHHEAHLYSPWIESEPLIPSPSLQPEAPVAPPSPLNEERAGVRIPLTNSRLEPLNQPNVRFRQDAGSVSPSLGGEGRGEGGLPVHGEGGLPTDSNLSPRFTAAFSKFQPNVSLIVSGGHTLLVLVESELKHRVLGGTIDDAAGECFDKTGKLMGLPYPAGPIIDRLAEQGNPDAYDFPRPLLHDATDDFSFSGLKTSVRYFIRDHPALLDDPQKIRDLCASVQAAIVEVLVKKTLRAAKREGVSCITASGGVTCNSGLRRELARACQRHALTLRLADKGLCTDNAAMIGILAERKLLAHPPLPPLDDEVIPGWALA